MKKTDLKTIGSGFYQDGQGKVFLDMEEFLAAHQLPNTDEVKKAVWQEVQKSFGTDVQEIGE